MCRTLVSLVLAASFATGCPKGRSTWRIAFFEAAGDIAGRYRYYPLKVAARGDTLAVVDGAPNLGVRNSRVLVFRKRTGALVTSREIPRGAKRGAKGHAVHIDAAGRIYVAVEDEGKTHLMRLTPAPGGRGYDQEWDSILGGKYPTGIWANRAGEVWLVDGGNHRIIRMPWKGLDPVVIGSSRELDHPRGLAVDERGVIHTHTVRNGTLWLLKYGPDGKLLSQVAVPEVKEPLAWVYNDLVVDARGRIYLSDYAKARVLILDSRGKVVQKITHPSFKEPMGLAMDEEENLYVADAWAKKVLRFRPVYEHERKRRAAGAATR